MARFEITAFDTKAARAFYAELFGWKIKALPTGGASIVETGDGIHGTLIRAENGTPTFVTVYVEVDDVDEHLARAEALGGTIYVPAGPSPFEGERCFGVFGDPEGNLIGVVQH